MRCLALIISALIFSTSISAQEETPPFGLAMHGSPKYERSDTHLTYANPDAATGGKIKIAAIGTFDTLNPFSIKGKGAQGLNLVYDKLMARVWDEAFTLYPLIAERADIPEDRSSVTFHLNPKAKFHDGSPITTDDLIYSFETLKESGRPNMRRVYRLVESVEKTGERAVHFKLGEGYDRETVMILAIMPIISKAHWSDKTFDKTTLDTPLLTGPYEIKSLDAGRSITYKRKDGYWAKDLLTNVGHHNFDEITYDYYRDDTVAFEAFKSGETDFRREGNAGQWSSAYDFPAIAQDKITKEALPHGRPERTRGFIFNTRRAPFDDIEVRKALALLFDFEWVNKNLFHGQYKRIDSYFPNSELADPTRSDENATLTPREKLRKANATLTAAGWHVQGGKRVKDGKELSFEIMLSAPEEEKIALHFARSLKRMGINMRIRVLDSAAFRGRLNEYDFDMVSYFWQSSLSPGTEQLLYWGCQAAKEPSRWNFSAICTPEIDALSTQVADTFTREELVKTMQTLDKRLMDGHYMIPLYYAGSDYAAFNARIKHPKETPLYGMVFETWWIDAAPQ